MLILLIAAAVWSVAFLVATALCRSAACADRGSLSAERFGERSRDMPGER
jgi:hypothetical protein